MSKVKTSIVQEYSKPPLSLKLKATPDQHELVETIRGNDLTILTGQSGTGKTFMTIAEAFYNVLSDKYPQEMIVFVRPAVQSQEDLGFLPGPQPLYSKVLTPTGWTTMGSLKPGDFVTSYTGEPVLVKAVRPRQEKTVYRVLTTEGETHCCLDHLWLTRTFKEKKREKEGKVRSLAEIKDTLLRDNGKPNHYLPRNGVIQYSCKDLPIPPYLLGALLGDGSMSENISFYNQDQQIIDRVAEECNLLGCTLVPSANEDCIGHHIRSSQKLYNNKSSALVQLTDQRTGSITTFPTTGVAAAKLGLKRTTLRNRCVHGLVIDEVEYKLLPKIGKYQNPIKEQLHKLGLLGKKANDKFIPDEYKISSEQDRLALLRGLMDTDGTVKERTGEASFSTTSKQLAKDLIEIVRSLGGRAIIRRRDRVGEQNLLSDRTIHTRLPSYEFTISLSQNPFHTSRKSSRHKTKYLQHIKILSIEEVGTEIVQCIQLDGEAKLYITDDFLVTHNSADEKTEAYMSPFWECAERLVEGKLLRHMYEKEGSIELTTFAFLRGRTLRDAFIIVDEAQNCTKEQIKLVLTRVGKNSKAVIIGDVDQSDRHDANGLEDAVERFAGIIPVLELGPENNMRSPLVNLVVAAYQKRITLPKRDEHGWEIG